MKLALLLCLLAIALPGHAQEYNTYAAAAQRIIDGDTLELQLYLGMGVYRTETARLKCVNTPETHGPKAKDERPAGLRAQGFVERWLHDHVALVARLSADNDRDVYGRILVFLAPADGSKSLNRTLLDAGYSELYMCKSIELR